MTKYLTDLEESDSTRSGAVQHPFDQFTRRYARGADRRFLLRAAAAVVTGLTGGSHLAVGQAAKTADISLDELSSERIAGRFTVGNTELRFDSTAIGPEWATVNIADSAGQEQIAITRSGDEAIARYGGGAFTAETSRARIRAVIGNQAAADPAAVTPGGQVFAPPDSPPNATASGQARAIDPLQFMAVRGDTRAPRKVLSSPEFALLPHLSYTLGREGGTGTRYRPSLGIHALGMTAGVVLGVDPSPPGVSYRYRLPPFARRPNVRALFDLMTTTDCYTPGDEISPLEPMLPTCPRGDGPCRPYPNRDNGCFGMCGARCNCWEWVCGDCCLHDFCANHDAFLRSCDGVSDVASCVFAGLPINFLAFGCDGSWLWF